MLLPCAISGYFFLVARSDLQVGYGLTPGLPGYTGSVRISASGGKSTVSVLLGQSDLLEAGLFIEIDGDSYEIESVGSLNETIILVEVRSWCYRPQRS